MILNRQEKGIGMLRIKNLINPHHRNHICVAQILNVVSIPYWYINHLKVIARYKVLINFLLVNLTKTDYTLAANNKKLLILGMMPMLTFSNARLRYINRNLTSVGRLQELRKRTPLIHIHLKRIRKPINRKITKVCRVKFLSKLITQIGNMQITPTLLKRVDKINNLTKCNLMLHRHTTKLTYLSRLALKCRNQLPHHIINIHKSHIHRAVVHLNRQIISHIITKRSHSTIIIWSAPLPKHIREPVNKHLGTNLPAIIKQQILTRLFRNTVRIIKLSLNRRSQHHRAIIAMPL